eukprot:CAMPEP_0184665504 /NCGR_PEP_ID=MMETSP0308-20130426/57469_1 /TAXON_ID=38269 /ORGANISM="Gloeochaete witrockiana, Strain SAG 46.84" /LENGTH=380 /DNA_ID=CAMNT_0027109537 /DNA_START=39 /DNA_END=1178 /DNA_ORIENTATION=+
MEFPDLGKNCDICNQLDFLPFRCICGGTYCHEHQSYASHNCPRESEMNRIVPICPLCNVVVPTRKNEDPDAKVDEHISLNCPKPSKRKTAVPCSFPSCKKRELVPVSCKACRRPFCVSHRHELDHECPRLSKAKAKQKLPQRSTNTSTPSPPLPQRSINTSTPSPPAQKLPLKPLTPSSASPSVSPNPQSFERSPSASASVAPSAVVEPESMAGRAALARAAARSGGPLLHVSNQARSMLPTIRRGRPRQSDGSFVLPSFSNTWESPEGNRQISDENRLTLAVYFPAECPTAPAFMYFHRNYSIGKVLDLVSERARIPLTIDGDTLRLYCVDTGEALPNDMPLDALRLRNEQSPTYMRNQHPWEVVVERESQYDPDFVRW